LCRYVIERKGLGRLSVDEWLEVERDIIETTHRLTGYDPQFDCLYRVRAHNEFGLSEPTMPVSYYGKQSMWKLFPLHTNNLFIVALIYCIAVLVIF